VCVRVCGVGVSGFGFRVLDVWSRFERLGLSVEGRGMTFALHRVSTQGLGFRAGGQQVDNIWLRVAGE
jgi:hypothetical protein